MKKQIQKPSFRLLLVALFLIQIVFAKAQTVLQNANFELTNNPVPTSPTGSEFLKLDANNNLLNWTHSGDVDVHHFTHHSMGSPSGGLDHHVDLNGSGHISQTMTNLKPGGVYTLSFYTSVHALMIGGYCDLYVKVGPSGSWLSQGMALYTTDKPWAQRTYTFTATSTTALIEFYAKHSGYSDGGALIDNIELTLKCDPECNDEDWLEVGTTYAPKSHFNNMFRIGNAGIGTYNPTWNFKLTVDNTEGTGEVNNYRNAIHAIALHDDCTYGYGIMVSTNAFGGTKAVAVKGNGSDKAITYGNGMGWFSNRVTIGGDAPVDICEEEPDGGPILVVNGDATINGVNVGSDMRFKKNIANIENSFSIIEKLNPVAYEYRSDEFANRHFSKTPTYGFIAQEIKEVLPNVVRQEKDGYYSVNYIAIIPVLTQAIKDQQQTINKLEEKMATLEAVNAAKGSFDTPSPTQKEEINTGAVLFQNTPNPLNNVTFIEYYLPESTQSAFIKVFDNNGKLVKAFPINQTGYGQLELDCTNLQSGTYHYSLLVDKQVIETMTMVVAKN